MDTFTMTYETNAPALLKLSKQRQERSHNQLTTFNEHHLQSQLACVSAIAAGR